MDLNAYGEPSLLTEWTAAYVAAAAPDGGWGAWGQMDDDRVAEQKEAVDAGEAAWEALEHLLDKRAPGGANAWQDVERDVAGGAQKSTRTLCAVLMRRLEAARPGKKLSMRRRRPAGSQRDLSPRHALHVGPRHKSWVHSFWHPL